MSNVKNTKLTYIITSFIMLLITALIYGAILFDKNRKNEHEAFAQYWSIITQLEELDNKLFKLSERLEIISNVETNFSWHTEAFDRILIVNFKFKNKNNIDVKDILVECKTFSRSETQLDVKQFVIYDVIKSNKTKNINGINMGFINNQTYSASCYVEDLVTN